MKPSIQAPSGEIVVVEPGIFLFRIEAGAVQGEEEARANLAALHELAGNQPILLIVDMREAGAITREARQIYAAAQARAHAMVVGSPFTRIMANVALRLAKPTTPVRLFDSEDEAIEWMRGFV